MIDNRILARDLRARGLLPIACDPDAIASPQPTRVQWDRVEGMLLGLAIGDALGNTSESMPPAERVACHGEIRDYLPNRFAMSRRVGLPSDDTQLALWTLERLARDGGLDPARLSDDFSDGRVIFGLGSSVREFLRRRKAGVPWERAGAESAGNGALMRIAPVLVPHLGVPSTALWADAALAGAITHRDAASIASCVAFIRVLWEVLQLAERPRPGWFVETFCETARQVEGDDPRYESRAPAFQGRRVALWSFARGLVTDALERGTDTVDACDSWHSGAYLLETVPSALLLLERFAALPEEAVVRAVNDTWDNDTVAAIVGAAVGALHGVDGFPRRWRDGLLGRTGQSDDGAVFRIIDQARRAFAT